MIYLSLVNNVGGSVFAECVRALAYQGRTATVGYVDGVLKAEMDIEALHAKRLVLFGVSNKLRSAEQRAESARRFVADTGLRADVDLHRHINRRKP